MSSTTVRLSLARAQQLAAALVADLERGCDRIEVSGSIRRRCREVGDVEIVAVPRLRFDLIGNPDGTYLDHYLACLCDRGDLRRLKGGDKYRQYELPRHGCKLDLFLTTSEQFGLILLIRTGPAEFSQRFVTQQAKGGLLPNDLRVSGGRLWRGNEPLATPEERTVFELAGASWLEPWERR